MPHEVINTLRAKSTVRIVGNTSTLITLSALSANSSIEKVTDATLAQVSCVSDGIWRVYRGDNASGVLMMEIPQYGNFIMYEYDITLSNSATSNIYVTNSGTVGTMLMQVSKNAIYTPNLYG